MSRKRRHWDILAHFNIVFGYYLPLMLMLRVGYFVTITAALYWVDDADGIGGYLCMLHLTMLLLQHVKRNLNLLVRYWWKKNVSCRRLLQDRHKIAVLVHFMHDLWTFCWNVNIALMLNQNGPFVFYHTRKKPAESIANYTSCSLQK